MPGETLIGIIERKELSRMQIEEIHTLTEGQIGEIRGLMRELAPEIAVSARMVENVVEAPGTHLFAALDEEGHIVGCASLCVFDSPTGRKASVEDVAVLSAYRGRHIGRALVEHVIDYARENLGDIDLQLTSKPVRVAANALYQSLGFKRRETNCYRMKIRHNTE